MPHVRFLCRVFFTQATDDPLNVAFHWFGKLHLAGRISPFESPGLKYFELGLGHDCERWRLAGNLLKP
jgi:hypothetical protein